jgi:hypothetical protein
MMEHGARRCRGCGRCGTKSDAEKATEFMEAYVLGRARALHESMDIEMVLRRAKEAYLTIHKKNLDEIRREMGR